LLPNHCFPWFASKAEATTKTNTKTTYHLAFLILLGIFINRRETKGVECEQDS